MWPKPKWIFVPVEGTREPAEEAGSRGQQEGSQWALDSDRLKPLSQLCLGDAV